MKKGKRKCCACQPDITSIQCSQAGRVICKGQTSQAPKRVVASPRDPKPTTLYLSKNDEEVEN